MFKHFITGGIVASNCFNRLAVTSLSIHLHLYLQCSSKSYDSGQWRLWWACTFRSIEFPNFLIVFVLREWLCVLFMKRYSFILASERLHLTYWKWLRKMTLPPPPPPNTNSQTFTHSTPPNRSNSIAQANMDRDRFNVVWQLESECITNTMSCNKCLSSVKFDYCGNDNFDHDFGIFLLSYTENFNTYIIWHVFRCQLVTRRYVCQEERYNINNIYKRYNI